MARSLGAARTLGPSVLGPRGFATAADGASCSAAATPRPAQDRALPPAPRPLRLTAQSGEHRPSGRGGAWAERGRSGPEQRDAPRSPAGLQACQLALSARTVWARCPNSHLARRYGITDKNPAGDYWKKVPGTVTCFTGRCRALRGSRGCVLRLTGCSYGSRGREPPARAPPRLTLREGSHHPSSARVPRKGTRCWATHFELGNRHRSWVAWGARSWKVPCLGPDPGARLQLPSPRPG